MMLRQSISSSILSNIAISLLLIFTLNAQAHAQGQGQQGGRRLTKAQQEKLRMKAIDDSIPLFRGVAVKADLVGAVEKAVGDYGQLEAGVKVNLKDHYFPTIEVGLGKADHHNEVTMIDYKTSAPYFKVGCDFNVMKNRHDIYRVYVGARYAMTSFKFDLSHPDVIDPVWGGETPYGGRDIKANCHWAELLGGIEAKIWGPISLGWSARYKRRISHDNGPFGNVWYVPGYGKAGSSRITATFDVIVKIW